MGEKMRHTNVLATLLLGYASLSTATLAAPLTPGARSVVAAPSFVEKVWCHHGYCDGGDGGVGGLIGGLVGGAIAAGAASAAAQQDAQAQAVANQRAAACARQFRSYDPASGTYVRNGRRYPCP